MGRSVEGLKVRPSRRLRRWYSLMRRISSSEKSRQPLALMRNWASSGDSSSQRLRVDTETLNALAACPVVRKEMGKGLSWDATGTSWERHACPIVPGGTEVLEIQGLIPPTLAPAKSVVSLAISRFGFPPFPLPIYPGYSLPRNARLS